MEASIARKISTSALARSLEMPVKDLFHKLESSGWIERSEDNWQLTEKGKLEGGEYTTHVKFGTYIIWPEMIHVNRGNTVEKASTDGYGLTATQIGERHEISARQVNWMFAELGWIKRSGKGSGKGWTTTENGEKSGARQQINDHNKTAFVSWPESVLGKAVVIASLKETKGDLSHAIGLDALAGDEISHYRQQFPARLRAADGHLLRSKTELMIDNWLYMAGVTHSYERRLPIEEEVYGEFYLPGGNVYIEYLGQSSDVSYRQQKEVKLKAYQSHNLNLITLNEDQLKHLDLHMPRLLQQYGIRIY